MNTKQKYVVIGDVHGDFKALEKLLYIVGVIRCNKSNTWISIKNYKVILLGDLNDYRFDSPLYSSWKCLKIGIELCQSNIGIVLHSNHHERLLKYFNSSNNSSVNKNLFKTVQELQSVCSNDIEILKEWLSTRPLTYSFSINNKLYSCVHAYYPKDNVFKDNPNEYKTLCINGIRNKQGKRILWWEYPEYIDNQRIVLCGHYHVFINTPNVIVLDGQCGIYSKGVLIGYIPEEDKFIKVKGVRF